MAALSGLTQKRDEGESAMIAAMRDMGSTSERAMTERKTRIMSALRSRVKRTVEPKDFMRTERVNEYKNLRDNLNAKIMNKIDNG